MKLILMGTPDFVVPIFDSLAVAHEIAAVFTRAPKPVGRKKTVTKSPVHRWADGRGIPVETDIKGIKQRAQGIDFIVVAAYGMILKDDVLNAAPCINIHPSDLPKYRGPSPISTAIYNGDSESAVCLMHIAHEVDAGDIYMRKKFSIGINDTLADVEKKVSQIAIKMLAEFFGDSVGADLDGTVRPYPRLPQIGIPTFTRKWTSADEIIDPSKSAWEIHNQVRSIGGRIGDVKILETEFYPTPQWGGADSPKLEIIRVQPAGGKPMLYKDYLNGHPPILLTADC